MSTPGMGSGEMHDLPVADGPFESTSDAPQPYSHNGMTAVPIGSIADIVQQAETVGMPVMGDEPFSIVSTPDTPESGSMLDTRDSFNVFRGGQFPPDTAVVSYPYPSFFDRLPEIAVDIAMQLKGAGFREDESLTRQLFAVAEECGEFVGAVRRFYGLARRNGSWEEVQREWADLVFTVFLAADTLGMGRAQMENALNRRFGEINARPWRETPPPDPAQRDLFAPTDPA